MGAPVGNENAKKPWQTAIKRALARRANGDYNNGLNDAADKLIEEAIGGNLAAIKELGDRLDGRPTQLVAGDEEASPIQHSMRVLFGRDGS